MEFKSGFCNIIGHPNVGKSTLMNTLVGERMSIITNKPQTTRHRIIGIVSTDEYQIVFSDSPGFIKDPKYKMQELMNKFVQSTFDDADVMLFVTEPQDEFDDLETFLTKLRGVEMPLFLVLNKIDTITEESANALVEMWKAKVNFEYTIKISALNKTNIDELLTKIVSKLPPGPEYYPKDQLTDRPERFFVSEIIREKILMNYSQEIPYSVEIGIESYQETKTNDGTPIARITALIFVERETQKMIILGKGGASIKKLGTMARLDIEKFIETKVFLELRVKVKDNWRDDDRTLKYFGYNL